MLLSTCEVFKPENVHTNVYQHLWMPRVLDPASWIQNPVSSMQDPASWIPDLDPESCMLEPGTWIHRILDPRSWIQGLLLYLKDPESRTHVKVHSYPPIDCQVATKQAAASAEKSIPGKSWWNNKNIVGWLLLKQAGTIADKKLAGASGKKAIVNA